MRKVYSIETKQLFCSLFREFKTYRGIEALTDVPRDMLRLSKGRARNNKLGSRRLKGSLSFLMKKKKKLLDSAQ